MTISMDNSKKFDLEKFMKGAIAKTSYGAKAKFGTISRDRLIVQFTSTIGVTTQETYQLNGKKYKNATSPFDLVEMV